MDASGYPKSCVVPTKSALQRFDRGPHSMQRLLHYVGERARLETQQKELLRNFHRKWKNELPSILSSNMPGDGMKQIAKMLSWLDGVRERFHSERENRLYQNGGPFSTLMRYVRDPDDVMKRVRAQKIYNTALASQEKLEMELQKSKEHYLHMKEKEEKLKQKIESADKHDQESPKFKELLEKWRKIEADGQLTKCVYHNNAEKESKTRSQFINDMKEFYEESDNYETRRVETMRSILRQFVRDDREVLLLRRHLQQHYNTLIAKLDNYEVGGDLDNFKKFFSHVYKFPDTQIEDIDKHKISNEDNDDDDDVVRYDTVRVFRPKKDQSTCFVKTLQLPPKEENHRVNMYSRHVTLPPPNPTSESFMPDMVLPNVVSHRPADKAPAVNITTLDMNDSDQSDPLFESSPHQSIGELPNDHDTTGQQQQPSNGGPVYGHQLPDGTTLPDMKVKVYGLKTFTARKPYELSFKAGRKVYMTKPADARGLAYGYVKKGKLKKKKVYGFFPADLVSPDAKKKKSSLMPRNPFKKPKDGPTAEEDGYISFMGGETTLAS